MENPYTPRNFPRQPSPRIRPEFVSRAVPPEPPEGFPAVPADLRPLPCPDGFGPFPLRAIPDKLNPTQLLILLHASGQFFDGHPCLCFPKGKVGETLGPLIHRAPRTAEDALKRLEARGYFTSRDQLHRDGMYTFYWANWALADELPEFGAAPDRSDPACDVPHRPAFVLPGARENCAREPAPLAARPRQPTDSGDSTRESAGNIPARTPEIIPDRETCAIVGEDIVPQPGICAMQPGICATGQAPVEATQHQSIERLGATNMERPGAGEAQASDLPAAYVYAPNSPPGEETYTCEKSTGDPSSTIRPFLDLTDEDLREKLGYDITFRIAFMYSPLLVELTNRGLPWPARYEGKPLRFLADAPPEAPKARSYVLPPGPAKVAESEALTLEQRLKRLAAGIDPAAEAAEIKDLTSAFMASLGENPSNRWSWNFHRRNVREVARRDMPVEVITEALAKFRSGGAEYPRKVFTGHVMDWRDKRGLGNADRARARDRVEKAGTHPALRA